MDHILTHDGIKLRGGSGFKKDFEKPFDKDGIAKRCANSWGVSESSIVKIWDDKGLTAREFGTAIHNLLERVFNDEPYDDLSEVMAAIELTSKCYAENKGLGRIIQDKRSSGDTLNYATPNHPVLVKLMKYYDAGKQHLIENIVKEDIINSLITLNRSLGFVGLSAQEPLVTHKDLGMGGFIDKLYIVDEDKKICRVQDYKIQPDAGKKDSSRYKLLNEFSHMIPTKVSGHTIQLNYYAHCLRSNGWTIEGLDLFVFDRKGWVHYILELFEHEWFDNIIRTYNVKD